jgi:uncharacterized protein GlcG (DUF336 family)
MTIKLFVAILLASGARAEMPSIKVLTVGIAQGIAQEALMKCHAAGFKVAVLVVDRLNSPLAMLRDEDAAASTTEVVRIKTNTVLLYDRPSGPPLPELPGTTEHLGGLPVKSGGATIGAIAVSGATNGARDVACASAALAKFAEKLK